MTTKHIVTSNLKFGRWNEIHRGDRLTTALIDRCFIMPASRALPVLATATAKRS
ncbi:MAG: hypothetical protein GX322_11940 [Firmicutes bacterium]|nr:hypothetical protein [Bacillota bacterium]